MFAKGFYDARFKASEPNVAVLNSDGSNKCDFYIPDVIGNRRFAQNYGGYPRSDIALINEQTDIAVAKGLLESLNDYSQPDVNQGRSDAEMLLSLRSKYCQTASEQIRYFENEISKRDNLRLASQSPIGSDGKPISFEPSDNPSDDSVK